MWTSTPTLPPWRKLKKTTTYLNIPRYVDTFEEEEAIDIAEVQKEIEGLESQLLEVRGKMAGYLKQLGVEVGTGGSQRSFN